MYYWTPLTTISDGHRRWRLFALALAVAALLAGPAATAKTLKIATTAPDGSSWMKVLRKAGDEVDAATEGRVKIKFFPGGVRGDDQQVLRRIRVRQLDGGILQTGVFGTLFTDVQIYNLPMLFQSLEEVDAVREVMDPILVAGLADAGFVAFGIAELGMAYAMSKKEARSLADARRLKVWSPQGDRPAERTLSAFRIKPIPLTLSEVLTGLQADLIDTVAAPPVAVLPLQWHRKLKYVLDLPFMYIYSLVVVTEGSLEGMTATDVVAVKQIMRTAVAEIDRLNRADHAAAWAALKSQGLQFLTPTDAEVAQWRGSAQTATEVWINEGLISREIHATLMEVLNKARSRQAVRAVVSPSIAGR
ncbi:MAG: TRAP transporter substrate-binding protein DctP [Gammaproteobacteria bacterium]|nr:TRAP transporter substrate-binding protein DctP [Gammaproteobacteria bacterium]